MSEQENKLLINIYSYGKKQRALKLTGNLALLILCIMVLWLSAAIADHFFYFSELTRWGLWIINSGILILLIFRFAIKPAINLVSFKKDSDLSQVTTEISQYYTGMGNSLSNLYHLIIHDQPANTSDSLKKAAIQKYIQDFGKYNFEEKLKLADFFPPLRVFIPIMAASILLFGFRFNEIMHSTLRLLNPANEYLQLPDFRFTVDPGNSRLIKGEPAFFTVTYQGPELAYCRVLIWHTETENSKQSVQLEFANGIFSGVFKDVREPFRYQIEGIPLYERKYTNHLKSEVFNMDVLIPPMFKNLDITVIPPVYSGLEKQFLDRNIGDISALAGTKVLLKADVSKNIGSAFLKFSNRDSIPAEIQGKRISASFQIKQNDTYRIMLCDTDSLTNRQPIDYSINVITDNHPYIEISEPGRDIESQLDASVALKIDALDDYGISRVDLFYKFIRSSKTASDTNWQSLLLPAERSKKVSLNHIWDFNTLPLAFEDGLMYYARVQDNNDITGPGIGKTDIFYIRFPSIEELFDTFSEKENEAIDDMDEIADQSKQLKEELEKINREMKRADQIEWEQKQQIENMLEKQKQIQEKMEDIRNNLEELVEQLENNNLISEEVLEKYMQLQELFREIAPPELLESMQKLQEALEKPDPGKMRQVLQEFKMNQEQFQKNIERTMELLKQVQLEQRLDQLVKMAESLQKQQEKITENLKNKTPGEDLRQLADQQKKQTSSTKNLEKKVDELLQEPRLTKFQKSRQNLNQALTQMQSSQMTEAMQKTEQEVNEGNYKEGAESSGQLNDKYKQLENRLAKAREELQNQNKQDIRNKMQAITRKILKLSNEQEKLAQDTEKASTLSDDLKDISVRQGRTLENFQRMVSDLVQLSKETFFIQPGISQALGKSQAGMNKSLDELSEQNNSQASRHQSQALSGLNEAVVQMLQSMSQLDQSQSGTGFEKFMEQLAQMAGAQGQINDGTLSMMPGEGNAGQYSIEQQAGMQRLAGQQAALRDALQKMSNEMGSRQDVLGRLGELAGKMDEVVNDLLQQNVNPKTIERQRQILSRMIDAQKSVNERELSRKRKAEQAKDYRVVDPGELKNLTDAERKKIQDALQRARSEGYQHDYQKLIETYFKQLLQKQIEKN